MRRPSLYIITTASQEQGWGHLSRCINLCSLATPYFEVSFILRKTDQNALNKAKANNLIIINEDDFKIKEAATGDAVIIDDYSFQKSELHNLKKRGFLTIEINDIPEQAIGADILINHTPGISPALFSNNDNKLFLLGPAYLLINPVFYLNQDSSSRIKQSILVMIGATDPFGITQKIINAALNENRQFHFVTGNPEILNKINPRSSHFHFHSNLAPKEVMKLMHTCEAVITTASTSALEAICCGCAVFAGTIAKNQYLLAQQLDKLNMVHNLGDLRTADWGEKLNCISSHTINKLLTRTVQFREDVCENKISALFEKIMKGNLWL